MTKDALLATAARSEAPAGREPLSSSPRPELPHGSELPQLSAITTLVRGAALLAAALVTHVAARGWTSALGGDAYLTVGVVYVISTAVGGKWLRRQRRSGAAVVGLDALFISGLVWYTGGLGSWFELLYYLPILNGGLGLRFREAMWSSILGGACYVAVGVASGLGEATGAGPLQLAAVAGSMLVLAAAFGALAASAAAKPVAPSDLARALERLSALYEVAHAIHARESLQDVTDTTLALAMRISGARKGYIALAGDAGRLMVHTSRTASGSPEDASAIEFAPHLAEHCAVQRTHIFSRSAGCNSASAATGAESCVLSMPFIHDDRLYGVLQLADPRSCAGGGHATELLTAVAQEAAIAMENARLLTEVHRLSVADELTGLYHRREFRRLLTAAVEAQRAKGNTLAVMLFDIDGMRRINIEHGHTAGDEVLLAFADSLRSQVRSDDVLARLGGDEFAVLMPRGGLDAARSVASRLSEAMSRRGFDFGDPHHLHRFTVSVGAVVAADASANADQLLGRADEALFEARRAGAGQVRFWEDPSHHGLLTQMRQIVDHVQRPPDPSWR